MPSYAYFVNDFYFESVVYFEKKNQNVVQLDFRK